MYRILKEVGSIYLQMDTRINHWLRIICDEIFEYDNFRNELSWCYRSAGFKKNSYSPKHDVILFYTKSDNYIFNLDDIRQTVITESMQKTWGKQIEKYGGYYAKAGNSKEYFRSAYSPPLDWFELGILPPHNKERLQYDTQKPKSLLEKVVKASSNKNDIVADFYMGSGTTGEVALELGRKFIGCDIGDKACKISKKRLINYK
jgi:DNA modification methylase